MESNYTTGYGDGKDLPETRIDILPGAMKSAEALLDDGDPISERMDRVAELIDGYEDAYGMELLSSMHWVMAHSLEAKKAKATAIEGVLSWNTAKRKRLKPEHLDKAWELLNTIGWS